MDRQVFAHLMNHRDDRIRCQFFLKKSSPFCHCFDVWNPQSPSFVSGRISRFFRNTRLMLFEVRTWVGKRGGLSLVSLSDRADGGSHSQHFWDLKKFFSWLKSPVIQLIKWSPSTSRLLLVSQSSLCIYGLWDIFDFSDIEGDILPYLTISSSQCTNQFPLFVEKCYAETIKFVFDDILQDRCSSFLYRGYGGYELNSLRSSAS